MDYDALVLDDAADMRCLVGQMLQRFTGAHCLELASVAELKAASVQVLAAKVAIIDINLGEGQPSGLDAFHWLREQAYRGRVYFLTGHARHHPLVVAASGMGAVVLEKPIRSAQLAAMVRSALGVHAGAKPEAQPPGTDP